MSEITTKELPVETYYKQILCTKCNVELIREIKKGCYMTDPPQLPYKCPECGLETILLESEIPGVKFRLINP